MKNKQSGLCESCESELDKQDALTITIKDAHGFKTTVIVCHDCVEGEDFGKFLKRSF